MNKARKNKFPAPLFAGIHHTVPDTHLFFYIIILLTNAAIYRQIQS